MVSMTTIVMMAFCVLVSIAALAIPFMMVRKRSSKIEAGIIGALCYGVLGYIWQYVFYIFVGLFLANLHVSSNERIHEVVVSVLLTFLNTALTALSLYWGIYLTNQKQLSIYRSAAVGIGFSLGKIGIDLIYPYITSIYFSVQINQGTFQAADQTTEAIRKSILETTVGSLLSGTYKCMLMFVIIFAVALIMGHYYIQKNNKMAWLSVLCIYETVTLVNVILLQIFRGAPTIVQETAVMVALTAIAAAGGIVLYYWFRYDEVEVNPLAVICGRGEREA